MINYKYKQFLKKIILVISIFWTGFLISLAQNQITVLKTDNRGFSFYYNPTSTPGFERKLKIGLSNTINDFYGEYSGEYNRGSFGYPLFEFSPFASQGYLDSKNRNRFRILNFGSTTNLISVALDQFYGYTKILFMPKKERVIFDTGLQNSNVIEADFELARIYANLKNLIAVYSCEEHSFRPGRSYTCLGERGVYKQGFEPPGATDVGPAIYFPGGNNNIRFYQNPTHCFGETDATNRELHYRLDICLGDCNGDDEGLTICIRQR